VTSNAPVNENIKRTLTAVPQSDRALHVLAGAQIGLDSFDAESRPHHQHSVDFSRIGLDSFNRVVQLERNTGFHTTLSYLLDSGGHACCGIQMKCQSGAASRGEGLDPLVGVSYHEVDFHGSPSSPAYRCYKVGPEQHVWHVMAVHNIDVKAIYLLLH
jgi:hypothetical protein